MNIPRLKQGTRPEDNELYAKIMIVFSVIQLILAALLYMGTALQPAVLWVLGGVALLGLLLAWKMWEDKKPLRILLRILSYVLIGGPLLFLLVTSIIDLIMNWQVYQVWDNFLVLLAYVLLLLCVFIQAVLLFLLPMLAMGARHGYRFDLVTVRVFSVLEVVLALVTCFYVAETGQLEMGIHTWYFSAFYCLCCAVTAVSSFVIYPIQFRRRRQKEDAAAKPAPDSKAPADQQAE